MIFNSKSEESLHRIKFHELIHECNSCGRTFSEKRSLYRHVRQVHAELDMINVILPIRKRTSNTMTTPFKRGKLNPNQKGMIYQ